MTAKRGWKHPFYIDAFTSLEGARAAYPGVTRFKRCYVGDVTLYKGEITRMAVAHWSVHGWGLVLGPPGGGGEILMPKFSRNRIVSFLNGEQA